METPVVTLNELKEFLLSLPDHAPLDMYDGDNLNIIGCLMTQYGRSKGWEFDWSYSYLGTWEKKNEEVVAKLEKPFVFSEMFDLTKVYNPKVYTAGPWKKSLL